MAVNLEGDWLLSMDGAREGAERFTIIGEEVRSEKGGTALLAIADGRVSFNLADGRSISIKLPGLTPELFSATVTERVDDDIDWADPASWIRA